MGNELGLKIEPSNYVCACCQNVNWGTKTKVKVKRDNWEWRFLVELKPVVQAVESGS